MSTKKLTIEVKIMPNGMLKGRCLVMDGVWVRAEAKTMIFLETQISKKLREEHNINRTEFTIVKRH